MAEKMNLKIKPDCDWIIGSLQEGDTARAKVLSFLQKSKFNAVVPSGIKLIGVK